MSAVPGSGRDAPSIEREVKYRLTAAQAATLHAHLARDARFLREETQDTTVFTDRAGLLREGSYLRLRTTAGRTELTLKGPKTGSGLDAWRTEHSVAVGPGPIFELLRLSGFVVRTRYVKRTRIYELRGALVYLDFVEALGWFCELETNDLDADLASVASALDLSDEDIEVRGYPVLTSRTS